MLPFVLERHIDEASFLFRQREEAAGASHYDLEDLAELDERLEAHLDGIRIAGPAGAAPCATHIERDPDALFPAAQRALELRDVKAFAAALDAARELADGERAIVGAIAWTVPEALRWALDPMVARGRPSVLHALGIAGFVEHRIDPGPVLLDALYAADDALRRVALEAVGKLGRADQLDVVRTEAQGGDAAKRFAAASSATLLGDERAAGQLLGLAETEEKYRDRALDLAMRRTELRGANAFLDALGANAETARSAVLGSEALGDPERVPFLLARMADPALARVAGRAFEAITGLVVRGALAGNAPSGKKESPTDEPDDEEVSVDPDAALPWPSLEACERAWAARRDAIPAGRLLRGAPISADHCRRILRWGSQWDRAAAAIELALLQPGRPLVEVRAPGFRQLGFG